MSIDSYERRFRYFRRRTKTENVSATFISPEEGETLGHFVADAETYGINKLWVLADYTLKGTLHFEHLPDVPTQHTVVHLKEHPKLCSWY